MDQRVRLIQEEEQGESVVALSEHYGVSRKTLYKWLARDEEHDTAGWAERNAVNPKRETARRRLSFQKTPCCPLPPPLALSSTTSPHPFSP